MSCSDLIQKFQVLALDLQTLDQSATNAPAAQFAARSLQNSLEPQIQKSLEAIEQNYHLWDSDKMSYAFVIDIFHIIQNSCSENKNNLHLIAQHSKTRKKLLRFIDDLLKLPKTLHNQDSCYLTSNNNTALTLAKEIRQTIRSTPTLHSAIKNDTLN